MEMPWTRCSQRNDLRRDAAAATLGVARQQTLETVSAVPIAPGSHGHGLSAKWRAAGFAPCSLTYARTLSRCFPRTRYWGGMTTSLIEAPRSTKNAAGESC